MIREKNVLFTVFFPIISIRYFRTPVSVPHRLFVIVSNTLRKRSRYELVVEHRQTFWRYLSVRTWSHLDAIYRPIIWHAFRRFDSTRRADTRHRVPGLDPLSTVVSKDPREFHTGYHDDCYRHCCYWPLLLTLLCFGLLLLPSVQSKVNEFVDENSSALCGVQFWTVDATLNKTNIRTASPRTRVLRRVTLAMWMSFGGNVHKNVPVRRPWACRNANPTSLRATFVNVLCQLYLYWLYSLADGNLMPIRVLQLRIRHAMFSNVIANVPHKTSLVDLDRQLYL